jgi:hypothetical protein
MIARVIDTSMAYKTSPNKVRPDRGDFPLGAIKLRSIATNQNTNDFYAYPGTNTVSVPLLGELVMCFRATSDYGNGSDLESAWYYLSSVTIHGNVNLNPIGELYTIPVGGNSSAGYTSTAAPKNKDISDYKPGENFLENSNVKNIQPYEGDIIIHGRTGQSIRLGSTIYGSMSQYEQKPFWTWKTNPVDIKGLPLTKGTPITIISNGHETPGGPNKYIIEDPEKTKSIFILSYDQKIKFTTSQRQIGVGVTPIGLYDKSQAIISADRLLFNSKLDEIILSSKKTVSIATPKWQMDMDKLFTILEKTLQQLADLTAGKAQFQTPMGGPTLTATNVAQVQQLLVELKTMKQ